MTSSMNDVAMAQQAHKSPAAWRLHGLTWLRITTRCNILRCDWSCDTSPKQNLKDMLATSILHDVLFMALSRMRMHVSS